VHLAATGFRDKIIRDKRYIKALAQHRQNDIHFRFCAEHSAGLQSGIPFMKFGRQGNGFQLLVLGRQNQVVVRRMRINTSKSGRKIRDGLFIGLFLEVRFLNRPFLQAVHQDNPPAALLPERTHHIANGTQPMREGNCGKSGLFNGRRRIPGSGRLVLIRPRGTGANSQQRQTRHRSQTNTYSMPFHTGHYTLNGGQITNQQPPAAPGMGGARLQQTGLNRHARIIAPSAVSFMPASTGVTRSRNRR